MPSDDQNDTGTPEIYVQPGESHLVRGPAILRTLLGSCVGVTFWNAKLRVAALCHPMLPERPVCQWERPRHFPTHQGHLIACMGQ